MNVEKTRGSYQRHKHDVGPMSEIGGLCTCGHVNAVHTFSANPCVVCDLEDELDRLRALPSPTGENTP